VVIVTGCSAGLGFQCVKSLAATQPHLRIVLACRNLTTATAAADQIHAETNCDRNNLIVLDTPLNLASLASVRAYAAAIEQRGDLRPIVSLINNAGIGGTYPVRMSPDGYEEIFATNHLGHFLLTLLLLPAIRSSGQPAIIMNVASEVHDPAEKTPIPDPGEDFPLADVKLLAKGIPNPGDSEFNAGNRRYSRSKLCNILFTFELNRRLQAQGVHNIRSTSFNPGLMLDTSFGREYNVVIRTLAWLLSPIVLATMSIARTSKDSGRILGAISTDFTSTEPLPVYYSSEKVKVPSLLSQDEELQHRLWAASIELAHMTEAELAGAV